MTTNKTTTKTETKTTSTTPSNRRILAILSYIAVCIGGVALFIAFILTKVGVTAAFVGVMQKVANAIGWIVVGICSVNFIKNKRKIWMWVVWTIAIVMIAINIFGL